MRKVVGIESNLKCGVKAELTDCTVLVGSNGRGKSTIMDSLALVTRGEAITPGLGKSPTTLNSMKAPGEAALRVVATMDDGELLTWMLSGSKLSWFGSKAGSAELEPVASFYGEEVKDILLGDPKRIRQAILRAAPQPIEMHRLLGECPSDTHDYLVRLFSLTDIEVELTNEGRPRGSQTFSTVEVEKVMSTAAAERRAKKKIIKSADSITAAAETRMTFEEEIELSELEDKVKFENDLPQTREDAAQRLQPVGEALKRAKEEFASMTKPYDGEQIEKVECDVKLMTALRKALVEVSHVLTSAGHPEGQCIMCASPFSAEKVAERISAFDKAIEASKEWAAWAWDDKERWGGKEREIAELEVLEGALYEIYTQGYLTNPVNRRRMQELEGRRHAEKAVAASFGNKSEAEADLAKLEAITKGLETIVSENIETSAGLVERQINQFLQPKNVRVKVQGDGKDISMSFGEGDAPFYRHRALSGAQKCLLAVAFAAATLPKDDKKMQILAVDDVALDVNTAKSLLRAIAQHVATGKGFTQAVVSLLSWGGKRSVEGWSFVDLDPQKEKRSRKHAVDPTKPKAPKGPKEEEKS